MELRYSRLKDRQNVLIFSKAGSRIHSNYESSLKVVVIEVDLLEKFKKMSTDEIEEFINSDDFQSMTDETKEKILEMYAKSFLAPLVESGKIPDISDIYEEFLYRDGEVICE